MKVIHLVFAAVLLTASAPPASATVDGIALNGTFTAVSDGTWAKTNDSFHDEATTTSTWTITSICTTFQDCTGQVVSDQGWTAPLVYLSGRWRAVRTVPDWERCADGSTAPGRQSFSFWPARADDYDAVSLGGWDETTGPSGACGINRSLVVRMPLRLNRIG